MLCDGPEVEAEPWVEDELQRDAAHAHYRESGADGWRWKRKPASKGKGRVWLIIHGKFETITVAGAVLSCRVESRCREEDEPDITEGPHVHGEKAVSGKYIQHVLSPNSAEGQRLMRRWPLSLASLRLRVDGVRMLYDQLIVLLRSLPEHNSSDPA